MPHLRAAPVGFTSAVTGTPRPHSFLGRALITYRLIELFRANEAPQEAHAPAFVAHPPAQPAADSSYRAPAVASFPQVASIAPACAVASRKGLQVAAQAVGGAAWAPHRRFKRTGVISVASVESELYPSHTRLEPFPPLGPASSARLINDLGAQRGALRLANSISLLCQTNEFGMRVPVK